jgi:beta-lactamase class A
VAERIPDRSILSVIATLDERRQKRGKGDTGVARNNPISQRANNRSNPNNSSQQRNKRAQKSGGKLGDFFASLFGEKKQPNSDNKKNSAPNSAKRGRSADHIGQPISSPELLNKPNQDSVSFQLNQTPNISAVTTPQGTRQPRRVRKKKTSPLLYLTRFLILGIGIAVISGTILSLIQVKNRSNVNINVKNAPNNKPEKPAVSGLIPVPLPMQLEKELTTLKTQIQELVDSQSNLTTGVFLIDVDTGGYFSINGEQIFPSASTIKVPILVALFQAVDEGKIRLDEELTLEKQHIAKGSGELQDRKPGSKFTVLETATKMITISDNTATNMLIERLGGLEVLNQQFQSWGLKDTVINNNLPDLEGTNTSSAKDLVNLMSQIDRAGLVSLKSRDRILHIMELTENNTLLPQGLESGTIIAHKTGTLNSLLADVGSIDLSNGQRYIIAVMVKYSGKQRAGEKLIKDISSLTSQYFLGNSVSTKPSPTSSPKPGKL